MLWSSIASIIGTMFTEMFSTNVGYTGITLGYQTRSALFGGTAPMIATVLLQSYHGSWTPLSTFICILCVASFISVTFLPGTKKASPVDSSILQGDIALK
jgi:hypothetical protein